MSAMQFTFPKAEHLTSRIEIDRLFARGSQGLTVYPVRAVYRCMEAAEEEISCKVLVSVSKRHFHHAVDRNRAKRQLREAYRLQKLPLIQRLAERHLKLHIAFLWLSDKPQDSACVRAAVGKLLQTISDKI